MEIQGRDFGDDRFWLGTVWQPPNMGHSPKTHSAKTLTRKKSPVLFRGGGGICDNVQPFQNCASPKHGRRINRPPPESDFFAARCTPIRQRQRHDAQNQGTDRQEDGHVAHDLRTAPEIHFAAAKLPMRQSQRACVCALNTTMFLMDSVCHDGSPFTVSNQHQNHFCLAVQHQECFAFRASCAQRAGSPCNGHPKTHVPTHSRGVWAMGTAMNPQRGCSHTAHTWWAQSSAQCAHSARCGGDFPVRTVGICGPCVVAWQAPQKVTFVCTFPNFNGWPRNIWGFFLRLPAPLFCCT